MTVAAGTHHIVDFRLDDVGSISGRVYDASTHSPLAKVNVQPIEVERGFYNAGVTAEDGTYKVWEDP